MFPISLPHGVACAAEAAERQAQELIREEEDAKAKRLEKEAKDREKAKKKKEKAKAKKKKNLPAVPRPPASDEEPDDDAEDGLDEGTQPASSGGVLPGSGDRVSDERSAF